MEKNLPAKQSNALSEGDIQFIVSIPVFMLWQVLVTSPVATLLFDGDSAAAMFMRFLVGIVGGAAFCYWLLFSEKGPGLKGIKKLATVVFKPVIQMPERDRLRVMIPVYAIALMYMVFTAGWLLVSDEASQKRALYNSWDRVSDIQWFHHDHYIDLYVYSETLDTLFESHVPKDVETAAAGVHIRYSSELMNLVGDDFYKMIRGDIAQARVGKIEGVTGEAEVGVFETRMTPFSFVSYHGMFGITGHGFLEIIMMSILMVISGVHIVAGKARSYTLLGFSVAFMWIASMPSIMSNMEKMPEEIAVIAVEEKAPS